MPTLAELRATVPGTGRVEAILLRTERRGAVDAVADVEAVAGRGLLGDRRAEAGTRCGRAAAGDAGAGGAPRASLRLLDRDGIDPAVLRRNLVVSGINLLALKDATFTVGEVVLEGTGPRHPCSRMEEALEPGGYSAMRGHGGITARVVEGGTIYAGDAVRRRPDRA